MGPEGFWRILENPGESWELSKQEIKLKLKQLVLTLKQLKLVTAVAKQIL